VHLFTLWKRHGLGRVISESATSATGSLQNAVPAITSEHTHHGTGKGQNKQPLQLTAKKDICLFTFDPQWNEPFQPVNSRNQKVGDLVLT
jgi:hypothetical protein